MVEWASRGDDASIARLRTADLWNADDEDAAVLAMLSASSANSIHDVNLRRGISAALTGSHSTRARTAFRTRAFAACFERLLSGGGRSTRRLDREAVRRLVDLGAPLDLLGPLVLEHAPEWGLTRLFLSPHGASWSQGKKTWAPSSAELTEIVLRSPRPGAVLSALAAHTTPPYHLTPASAMDDPGFLERLACDREFFAHHLVAAEIYARRILFHACRTGSERALAAVESIVTKTFALTRSEWQTAQSLCAKNCSPDFSARLLALSGAIKILPDPPTGLMNLVAYGAEPIRLDDQMRRLAANYHHGRHSRHGRHGPLAMIDY